MSFGVWGFGFGVEGFGLGVQCVGFGVRGLGCRVLAAVYACGDERLQGYHAH